MIRQLKFLLAGHLVYCIIRMMIYSWDHGYDAVFDLRFIQVIISMVGTAIVASLEEIFKVLQRTSAVIPSVEIPYFQNLDLAPAPGTMKGGLIYIKDYARVYRSDGTVWIPV